MKHLIPEETQAGLRKQIDALEPKLLIREYTDVDVMRAQSFMLEVDLAYIQRLEAHVIARTEQINRASQKYEADLLKRDAAFAKLFQSNLRNRGEARYWRLVAAVLIVTLGAVCWWMR